MRNGADVDVYVYALGADAAPLTRCEMANDTPALYAKRFELAMDLRRHLLATPGVFVMDRITEAYLDEFSAAQGISHLPQDARFEHFAGYVTLRRHYSQTFDTSDIVTGSGGDTGIDAIAVIANGILITDVETFTEQAERADYLDILFMFVQADRGTSFESAKIGTFSFGVLDFFGDTPKLPRNQAVADSAEIMTAVYKYSSKFKHGNPECRLYFVTTGKWVSTPELESRRQATISDLKATHLFEDVDFLCFGAEDVQRLYRQTKNAISREFQFQNRTDIPEIPGITEAYLGYVPVTQFLKIIQVDEGEILQSIFYDNVRDWQGDNPVNTEMLQTLDSDDKNRFVLMNNGVTVIARAMQHAGSRFTIEDFQIVNGCQTSHAIFNARKTLDDSVMIPLRLIGTENEKVIESIIRATNRQTAVAREQFFAVTDFAKNLEEFFQTFEEEYKLFYERRSRQYDRLTLEKSRIITPTNLIRAFAAMFLEEPHRTSRSYARVAAQVGTEIFAESHRLEPYYVAGFALYKLEYMFRNNGLETKYKPARYHLLLAVRLLANKAPRPRFNANEMERYCKNITDLLWDPDEADSLYETAAEIINEVAQGNFDRDNIRTEDFTKRLITRCLDG